MSHTIEVIAGGFILLGLFLLAGRLLGAGSPAGGMATAARWFIPVWLVGAGINMYIGVARAGYSVAEEAPILLLVFALLIFRQRGPVGMSSSGGDVGYYGATDTGSASSCGGVR